MNAARTIGASLLTALSLGCTAFTPLSPTDQTEILLPAQLGHVQPVARQILLQEGFPLSVPEGGSERMKTGYREEISGPWDSLLRARFGVGRSRVEISLSPEGDATRMTVSVYHEGKDGLFESWKPYAPPLRASAANYVRLVKNALGIL
jgi:hypothetical protein